MIKSEKTKRSEEINKRSRKAMVGVIYSKYSSAAANCSLATLKDIRPICLRGPRSV